MASSVSGRGHSLWDQAFVPKLSPTQDFCCPNNGFDLRVLAQLYQLRVSRVQEYLGWLQVCAEVFSGACLGGIDTSK